MKGLLLKDFYMIRRYCLLYFVLIIGWGGMMVFSAAPAIGIFPSLFAGMLPMTIQAYDERERWNKYSGTLPYTKNQLVAVKYIYSLILCALVVGILGVSMTVNSLLQLPGHLSLDQIAFWCSVYIFVCSFISLCLPFIFWLGAEKGRFVYMIFGGLCGATGAILGITSDTIGANSLFTDQSSLIVCVMIIALAALLYAISWGLSIALYRKREL